MFSKKEEQRTPFTVEKCNSCNKEIKRKFNEGDYIFKETHSCDSCNGKMSIEQIYGEIITN
jgi:hypothetical protein